MSTDTIHVSPSTTTTPRIDSANVFHQGTLPASTAGNQSEILTASVIAVLRGPLIINVESQHERGFKES